MAMADALNRLGVPTPAEYNLPRLEPDLAVGNTMYHDYMIRVLRMDPDIRSDQAKYPYGGR